MYTDPGADTGLISQITANRTIRVRDWLHGVRAAEPDKETKQSIVAQPLTEAERYRIVYEMITNPEEEGGAGIIPKQDQWENVESIFPLHDHKFNKEWIKKWSTVTFLRPEDLDEIRDRFGEKVKSARIQMETKLMSGPGRLLLRFYAVILCIPHVPCDVWFLVVGAPWLQLRRVRHCQRSLVCYVSRILEAAGA